MLRSRQIQIGAMVIAVAIAIITAVLLSKGNTPPLTPAFNLETASAQEVATQTCHQLRQIDHDMQSVSVNEHIKIVSTYQFSGDSTRWTGMVYTPDGATYLGKFDSIFHENVWYERQSLESDSSAWGPWEVVEIGNLPIQGSPFPCFDAAAAQDGNQRTDDERHVVWREESSHGTSSKDEFWVDNQGRPVRGLTTVRESSGGLDTGGASGAGTSGTADGQTGKVLVSITKTFSGYGEANNILAPITPPTPTPTPVPDPCPPTGVTVADYENADRLVVSLTWLQSNQSLVWSEDPAIIPSSAILDFYKADRRSKIPTSQFDSLTLTVKPVGSNEGNGFAYSGNLITEVWFSAGCVHRIDRE